MDWGLPTACRCLRTPRKMDLSHTRQQRWPEARTHQGIVPIMQQRQPLQQQQEASRRLHSRSARPPLSIHRTRIHSPPCCLMPAQALTSLPSGQKTCFSSICTPHTTASLPLTMTECRQQTRILRILGCHHLSHHCHSHSL